MSTATRSSAGPLVVEVEPGDACTPACGAKAPCGEDGCGALCDACPEGVCDANGQCVGDPTSPP